MEKTKVQGVELSELPNKSVGQKVMGNNKFDLVKDVKVKLQAYLGDTEISIAELFELKQNSVLKLDTLAEAPIDLVLDDQVVARGSLVVVDDNFGVQISEVVEIK